MNFFPEYEEISTLSRWVIFEVEPFGAKFTWWKRRSLKWSDLTRFQYTERYQMITHHVSTIQMVIPSQGIFQIYFWIVGERRGYFVMVSCSSHHVLSVPFTVTCRRFCLRWKLIWTVREGRISNTMESWRNINQLTHTCPLLHFHIRINNPGVRFPIFKSAQHDTTVVN